MYVKKIELPSSHMWRLSELSDDILNLQVTNFKIILKLEKISKY